MSEALIFTLERTLDKLNINCEKISHPPLATAKAADDIALERPGVRLKNLFLRDNYGRRHILLITAHDALVDLKALSKAQQVSRLGFASDERLARYLQVKPGCVSMLCMQNDEAQQVELWLDEQIWQDYDASIAYHCHPFDNTQTWLLQKADLEALFSHWQSSVRTVLVPKREASTAKA